MCPGGVPWCRPGDGGLMGGSNPGLGPQEQGGHRQAGRPWGGEGSSHPPVCRGCGARGAVTGSASSQPSSQVTQNWALFMAARKFPYYGVGHTAALEGGLRSLA